VCLVLPGKEGPPEVFVLVGVIVPQRRRQPLNSAAHLLA
jgi:hypothetical protein